jgi:hypothetical protein
VRRGVSRLPIAVALLATACGVFEREPSTAPAPTSVQAAIPKPAPGRTQADEIVAYIARLRGMSETALAAEAARQRRDPSDAGRVKAALALSLSLQSDEGEVLALVDPVAKKDNGDRDVRAVASFLQVLVLERRRLKESAAASGARLRDERRALDAQKQRAEGLQQKLDDLIDLEKSLSDRPSAPH